MRYFLYARKSTDTEDKQVLSIEAQLIELRALARRDGLEVVQEFVEKRSAKTPGRPVFEEMMWRVEKGEMSGIICWKIDRLSRNPVDSGRISWMLQQGTIAKIITHDRAYLPHDNVLLMSVEFGMANQYIRDLSVNVTRGLRQKARMGIYPSSAPLGYLNDPRTKTIVVNKKKSPIIRKAFEMYAEGKSRYEDIARFLFENSITTGATRGWTKGGGRLLKKDQIAFLLSNPFYVGRFRYAGEMYEGKHTPIVSKELFEKVQKVLKERSNKNRPPENNPQAYCGLLSCSGCGCSITAEEKMKVQKNGNAHRYVYYHCTKKRGKCGGEFVREEVLDAELSDLLSRFHLPREWAEEMNKLADKDVQEAEQSATASISELRAQITALNSKIARLTDLFVEQDVERGEYLTRERVLQDERRQLEEQVLKFERNAAHWLEPLREWIKDASVLDEIAESEDLSLKKSSLQKIFGSNLTLHAREARGTAKPHWFSLVGGKENQSENDLVPKVVTPRGI
ncbi:MAG: recombinase family protein, partial [Candidatus Yonathbacteria bacterium]|nr:recombinase family protein [Candidatus Yonathbacteria bacterium]